MLRMLCNEKRALGARNRNIENMLLAFIKIDEIVIPLSEITSTHLSDKILNIMAEIDIISSKISLIHTKL